MKQAAAALACAVVQLACAGTPAPALPLRGTTWQLLPAAASGGTPHLVLDATQPRLSGQGQCNRISGTFTLDGERLFFGQVVATRRACFPDDGAEQRFLQALAQVQRWRIEGGELLLLGSEGPAPLLRLQGRAP
jgi:copper homeostasis protein (lipoprotein)